MKNEVLEMIAKIRERKGRLDLQIVSGKHLRKISDRTALQSADNAEKFIATRKIDSFESLSKFTADKEQLSSTKHFAQHISDFAGITELDYRIVNKLIDKILISEPVEIDGEKIQRLTIHYRFVGALETLE